MSTEIERKKIQEMVDLETKGWDTKNPELFLSMIHPDMAWPWPPTADAHDPIDWVFVMGRFDRERWRKSWQELFDSYDLVHNYRDTVKIEISQEQDAAFAVVDIDTLWRHKVTKEESHWKARVCKIYAKLSTGEWKFYFQTGALNFPPKKGVYHGMQADAGCRSRQFELVFVGKQKSQRDGISIARALPVAATPLRCAPWSRRQCLPGLSAQVGGRLMPDRWPMKKRKSDT